MPEAKTKEMALEKMEGGGRRKAPGAQVEGGAGFWEEKEEAAWKTEGVIRWGSARNLPESGQGQRCQR